MPPIRLRHPGTGRTITVPNERVAAVHAQSGWEADDQADHLQPGTADELVAWIGEDPDRAQQATQAEQARAHPRKTVLEHAARVLAATQPDTVEET